MRILTTSLLLLSLFWPQASSAKEKIHATVDWAHRVELTIPVDGVVESVHVNTGQKVKKGKLLVKLDSRVLAAKFKEMTLAVDSLSVKYAEVLRELERAIELYDRTVLSEHDLQVAKNNKAIALAELERSKSNLIKAKVDLEYASLKAPFDSIILNRSVEVGQVVINNLNYDKLITLAASNKFLAKAAISTKQSHKISIGQLVKLTLLETEYTATIIAIEQNQKNEDKKSILVVEFKSDDKNLHVGTEGNLFF